MSYSYEPVDLVTPAENAIIAAIKAAVGPDREAQVRTSLQQNLQPPYWYISAVDSEDESQGGEQVERLTVDVQCVYRGNNRAELRAMMQIARVALDRKVLPSDAASLGRIRWVAGSAVGPARDLEYAGNQQFELIAEPLS